jgi:hypothetical protein
LKRHEKISIKKNSDCFSDVGPGHGRTVLLSFYGYKSQQYMISLERTIQNADPDIIRINNSIIAKDGDVEFIETLEQMAKTNGLSVSIDSLTLENNPILAGSNVTILRIKAKTQGSWLGTYTFLSELESLPLKIKVDKFGFANGGSDTQTPSGKSAKATVVWQSIFEIVVLKYK